MRYKRISVRIARSIRLEKWVISKPEIEAEVTLEPEDDPGQVWDELKEDLHIMLGDLVQKEIDDYVKGINFPRKPQARINPLGVLASDQDMQPESPVHLGRVLCSADVQAEEAGRRGVGEESADLPE